MEEAIYYSDDEEEEETMEKGDTGGKEEKPADNRVNGPIDTSIPQETTTPPAACKSEDGAMVEESSKAMDEMEPEHGILEPTEESSKEMDEMEPEVGILEPAGKSSKEMDEKESPEEGIIQQVIQMMDNNDNEVTTEKEEK